MLRYASSLMLGLFAVLTLFVVMQSFVVGRQFQLTAGASGDNSAVVNLSNVNAGVAQIGVLPDKPGTNRAPSLPENTDLERVQLPDIPAPAMGLPGFKPPFTAVAAETQTESNEEAAAPTPGAPAGQTQQPVLAVGDLVLVDRVEPKFPTQAIREGIGAGSVTIKFTVQTDGSVTNPVVTDAKPRRGIFDDAALRAVAHWKFKPIVAAKDTVVTVDFSQGGG